MKPFCTSKHQECGILAGSYILNWNQLWLFGLEVKECFQALRACVDVNGKVSNLHEVKVRSKCG
jgi:hypothetical protein